MKARPLSALGSMLVLVASSGWAWGQLTGAIWTGESNQKEALFGSSVASAGDVNGDGFDDVIVGAWLFDNGQDAEGRAFLYLGSADGLSPTPAWTAESDQERAYFGYRVASAGDVNGDGFDDVLIGARRFDNGQLDEGRVSLYLGSAGGLSLAPDWTGEGGRAGAGFGSGVAGAGDVNGDGFDDVIIGAPGLPNGATSYGRTFLYLGSASGLSLTPAWTAESDQEISDFGWCVASAGDVNGDDFDDVVVGAPFFDNGFLDEGRTMLYLGSASGLSLVADWTTDGGQERAVLGYSVAGVGDVNGDGFDDIAVGAPHFGESDEGRALVYLGSPSGPSLTADWTAEGEEWHWLLGGSVAGAGDVNGDGFDDLIVGASHSATFYDHEGRVLVFLGSASGLSLTADRTLEGTQEDAWFGESVAGAGDVDGDGFADFLVGAPYFNAGNKDEGRAYLYPGEADPDGPGAGYCIVAVNSSGSHALLSASGSDVALDQHLVLRARGCPAGVPGLFFFGTSSTSVPFGDGFRCVGDPITRIDPVAPTSSAGVARRRLDFAAPYASSIVAGADLFFQYGFRDATAGMSGFNLSNGLRIRFQ